MQLQTGTLLHQGEYRILSVLGQGGFGITYLGLQQGLERRVAIKEFFMKDLCNRQEGDSQVSVLSEGARQQVGRFRQKFLKEAKTLAALDNPHIIRIHNVFEENGTAYYVMEYIEDGSLKDLVNARGSLPEAEALGYIRQLADALNYLHCQKILHLDLKPANVLLKGGQTAVLIDFGISKRYDEDGSQTSSTPAGISRGYAPLEQYNAGGVSRFQPCTDIYSLGATLYTLVTGQVPPAATDVYNDGLPALPSHISAQTAHAIEKAMSPRPKERPQSVEEFLKLLENGNGEITKTIKKEPAPSPKEKKEKKENTGNTKPYRLYKIIGGVVAAIVVVAGLLAIPSTKDTPKEVKEVDYTPLFTRYKSTAGKYGYIGVVNTKDSLKAVVIPPTYDGAWKFNEGLAAVKLNGKYGYINKLGQEIVPLKYDAYTNGLAFRESFSEGMAPVRLNEKFGYVNKQGQEITPIKYEYAANFCEGLAQIKLNGKYGYINQLGEEVVPPKYEHANDFCEGLALVESNGKYGYINQSGEEVVPCKYDYAYSFSEGLAMVISNKKYGYIDPSGKEIVPHKYDGAGSFREGLAMVELNGKYGYINKQGQEIIPIKYEEADPFKEGLARIKLNGKFGYVNKQGQEVVPPKYSYSYFGSEWNECAFNEGMAIIKSSDRKYGYINSQGQEVVPPKYTSASLFNEGMAKVDINWKYGYINKQGQEIVPCQYSYATDFYNGLALVQTGNTCYFLNTQGEQVLKVTINGQLGW